VSLSTATSQPTPRRLPLAGISALDAAGQAFNDPAFADAAADSLLDLMRPTPATHQGGNILPASPLKAE
jgi:uncharacterized protein (UPF0261 family)